MRCLLLSRNYSERVFRPGLRYARATRDLTLALLPFLALPLACFGQRWLEVSAIAIGAHPATRTLDARELARPELEELVCLARLPPYANAVVTIAHGADTPDASIGHANAISHSEATRHL